MLEKVFSPYGFAIQQVISNELNTQTIVDASSGSETDTSCKLLGMSWDRVTDKLSCRNMELDAGAKTKRQILSSVASNYDLFGLNLPILNRSRLFLHSLQNRKDLHWDTELSADEIREWKNISIQYNRSPKTSVDRCFGRRSDPYRLVC